MRINHNIAALNTHRQLSFNNTNASKNLEKLSSGLKINKAGDDAAGLAISEKMRGQIRGLEMASKNAQDGISLIQTAEGALNETHSILQRMRELAVQSSNDTNTDSDRKELQKEVDQLASEISRISNDTEFNTQNLAGGKFSGTFHIGSNEGQTIDLSIGAMDASSLGVARNVTEATGTGSGSVSNVKIGEKVGAGIVDNTSITVSAAAVTEKQASGSFGAGKPTIAALDAGSHEGAKGTDLDVVISASSGATVGAAVSGNTLTITLDSDNPMDSAAINAALQVGNLDSDFQASGTGNVADTDSTTLAGGVDADPSKVALTLTQGGTTQTVNVDKTATKVSVDSGNFEGLSFDAANLDTANGNIGSVAIKSQTYTASAATFDADGNMTNKAVAKGGINISTQSAADKAITTIQTAIDTVSAERSKLGAMQNRLEHTINNLGTSAENLTAAESRIRDVDMAKEMMEFTKNNILTQAAQAMLAQSNQMPQGVLQLLR